MTPKVIHRDIKPSNVLIKYQNDHTICKLCDFGLSKILEKQSSNTSSIGTPRYRAPEIYTGNYSEKIDIYSLGISTKELFYNLLVNKYEKDDFLSKLNKLENITDTK